MSTALNLVLTESLLCLVLIRSKANHDAQVSFRLGSLRERLVGQVSAHSTRLVAKIDSHRSTWVLVRRHPERGFVHMNVAALARYIALVRGNHAPLKPIECSGEHDVAVQRIKLTKEGSGRGLGRHECL